MACTPPTSASEVFCRAAKCNRLVSRLAMVGVVILTFIMVKSGAEFIRTAGTGLERGGAERVAGHLTSFAAVLVLQLSLLFVSRRRASAAHHAMVKANNQGPRTPRRFRDRRSHEKGPPRPRRRPRRRQAGVL